MTGHVSVFLRRNSFVSMAWCAFGVIGLAAFPAWSRTASAPATRLGNEPVMVTTDGGSHPTVSPDGAWVAYSATSGLVRIPAGGGKPQSLGVTGREPDWSHTGNLIAFRDGGDLKTVDAETHEVALVCGPGGWDDDPAWSPLGGEIAAQSSGNSIAIIAWPGGELTTIPCADPDLGQCEGEGPTWSPDGQWLAFEDGMDILKVARTGGTAVNLYHEIDSLDVTEAAWSPDGRWIAFVRAAGGEHQNIWIMAAEGAAAGMYQVTSGDFSDSRPAWSPDGLTIYFGSSRSGSSQIWKVAAPAVATRTESFGALKSAFR